MVPQWWLIVQAALATVSAGVSTVQGANLFHGGAQNTVTKIGSALSVLNAFLNGTAQSLSTADVHPDLAAHATAIGDTHVAIAQAVSEQ